jgi:hypothetical protein
MRIVYLAIVVFLGFAAAMCNSPRGYSAETDQIELPFPVALTCLKIEKVEKVSQYTATHNDKPFYVMTLDSNMDGKHDVMLIFALYRRDGDTYIAIEPSYVIVDHNYDGTPDEAFSIPPNGSCKDLKKISLAEILTDHKGV